MITLGLLLSLNVLGCTRNKKMEVIGVYDGVNPGDKCIPKFYVEEALNYCINFNR